MPIGRFLLALTLLLGAGGCTVDRYAGFMVRAPNHGRELTEIRAQEAEFWQHAPMGVEDPDRFGWRLHHYDLPGAGIGVAALSIEPVSRQYRVRKRPPRYQPPQAWAKRTRKSRAAWQRRRLERRERAMRDLNSADVEVLPPRHTVVVVPGFAADKYACLPVMALFANQGFRAIGVDLRGSGGSSGDWYSYGVRESTDLIELLRALEVDDLLVGDVLLYGMSYGGSVALMAAAHERSAAAGARLIDAVIAVAPFADLREVVPHFARAYFGWLTWFVSDDFIARVMRRGAELADFDPAAAGPLPTAVDVSVPVLLVHGEADDHVPIEQSEALARLVPQATLVRVTGHDHLGLLTNLELLPQVVFAWLTEQAFLEPGEAGAPGSALDDPAP